MDIDAATIWVATRNERTLKEARELGITQKMFNGNAKQAWAFVQEHVERYGVIPPVQVITESTGCVVKPPDEEDRITLAFLADELHERHQFKSLEYGMGEAEKELEAGNQVDAIAEIHKLSTHLREAKASQLQVHSLAEIAPEVLDFYMRIKAGETGIPFPWQIMTDMTLGMWPGTLTFFVARPGVGKTWTAVIIALHAWKEAGKRVLIVSPEMERVEMGERLVSKYGQFAYGDMIQAQLGNFSEKRLKLVVEELAKDGDGLFVLDNEDKLQPDYIEEAIDACTPDLVVIDSLYMLRVESGKVKKGAGSKGDRQERIVQTIEWMRSLSRRKKIPIVGIHQLSREGKVRKDAARNLKAGRGTGGLEDAVALSDALFWNAHNLFAMYQDEYMRQDKQLMYVPLKARRQAKMSSVVIEWDMTNMEFKQLGTRVAASDEGFKDEDAETVPY